MKSIQSIFYSWQSDLPKQSNQNAIRYSIREALNKIELEYEDVEFRLDEATRNMSGSPNIPETIFAKISNAEIFICDLTTINSSDDNTRKVPNPNVLIELGYAIAKLGWSRIIMLFNTEFGKFPDDMPFDIDRHRASQYLIKNNTDKIGKNSLTSSLVVAIKTIVDQEPEKEFEKLQETEDEKKRNLDKANLKWFMSSLHLNTFDQFLEYMPDMIINRIFYFRDGLEGILKSSYFHIYDKTLLKYLKILVQNLSDSLSYSEHYWPDHSGNKYIFKMPMDIFPSEKAEKDYKNLEKLRIELGDNMKNLLNHIRNNYLDINLSETSKIAFESYKKYIEEE